MPRLPAHLRNEETQLKPLFPIQNPTPTIVRAYDTLEDLAESLLHLLRPPERLTVSQAAEKYRYLRNSGSYSGPWDNTIAPYMVEPMDSLIDNWRRGVVFVGPAQCGKTDSLLQNWLVYSVMCDPMDMIMYSPSMTTSRDFTKRRIDRLHRHSKAVGALVRKKRGSDNIKDKEYANGMMLTLSWPSAAEFSGKPIPRVALTDYDRMEEDIDGEGSPYDLASKRTTTFGSFAMTLAESSPSRELTDHRWIASTPHEAPPTTGILALYNRGDKRRWYWPCPYCDKYFEGNFAMLEWKDGLDDIATAESTRMVCPHCGEQIAFDRRYEMQQWGMWLADGQVIDNKGRRRGMPKRSAIASYWLNGVAAAFTSWGKLVETYLVAYREFEKTGSEDALKKFYNTDLGEVYIPKTLDSVRIPEHLKARAEVFGGEDERVVPIGTRFLVACVDVQKNMFMVQVFAILPGTPFDMALVDRFDIRYSTRLNEQEERLWIKPGTYLEDWDLIIEQVMDKDYPLQGDPKRRMGVYKTICDSGGKEGVTTNAYNFYRSLRQKNKHGYFHLVKGDHGPDKPRARVTHPDSNRKDRNAGARGDVPVLMLNSNMIKDALSHRLDCVVQGNGMYRFPSWAPDSFYRELCAEIRGPKGWENPSHTRNEAWDLSYYCIGACVSTVLMVERLDWDKPPGWAAEWDKNDTIRLVSQPKRFAQDRQPDYDFAKFGDRLG